MGAWKTDPEFDSLDTINGGREFNSSDPITADIINRIIYAIIYRHNHQDEED